MLDLSKQTYDVLNSQLLEQLPILYETTCQILSICVTEFLRGHARLMQQIRIHFQLILNQVIAERRFRIDFENIFREDYHSSTFGTIELARNSRSIYTKDHANRGTFMSIDYYRKEFLRKIKVYLHHTGE